MEHLTELDCDRIADNRNRQPHATWLAHTKGVLFDAALIVAIQS